MTKLKFKDIKKMNKEDRDKMFKELKLGLVKARAEALKGGSSKIKNSKRAIAKILMINKSNEGKLKTNKQHGNRP